MVAFFSVSSHFERGSGFEMQIFYTSNLFLCRDAEIGLHTQLTELSTGFVE
jgi:hypothetical protein